LWIGQIGATIGTTRAPRKFCIRDFGQNAEHSVSVNWEETNAEKYCINNLKQLRYRKFFKLVEFVQLIELIEFFRGPPRGSRWRAGIATSVDGIDD